MHQSMATPFGISLLMGSMLVYSIGVLYFSRQQWSDLHILTINGWQTLLGGIFLLPAAAITYNPAKNVWDMHFVGSVLVAGHSRIHCCCAALAVFTAG